jgi:regulating synaptic membrane exocytosis protein 2
MKKNLIFKFANQNLFPPSESFDGRDKPSVLVTSPGSPDFNYQQKLQAPGYHPKRPLGRYQRRLMQPGAIDPNVSGRLQIKLGFEASTLQLIVTIVCAADFTYRPNRAARNPYAKVRLSILFKKYFIKF